MLEQQVKAMEAAEAQLDAAEESALSETEVLSQFITLKRALLHLVCEQRKASKRQLSEKKESIKQAQVQRGQKAFAEHMASLNTRLGKPYMPTVPTDFPGAIKGKRTVDSLRGAINDELARAKIAANEIADRIQVNLGTLRELAAAHAFLFADTAQIVLKPTEDCTTLVKARISEHQAAEQRRLDAERERMRQEEAARADREARERLEQEERQRQAEIDQARKDEALPAPVLDDLAAVATHVRDEGLAGIGARQAIAAAKRAPVVPAADEVADLRIGTINERLGFSVTADFLKEAGFEPAAGKGPHRFYRESQFPAMCRAIAQRAMAVAAAHQGAAATA